MDALTVTAGVIVALGGIATGSIELAKHAGSLFEKFRIRRRLKSLDSTPDSEASRPPTESARHNLPYRRHLVGRENEKNQVVQALLSRAQLVVIDGLGGVGKTALVLEAAHIVMHVEGVAESVPTPFTNAIWVSCNTGGFSLQSLLATIAKILDYPGIGRLDTRRQISVIFDLLRRNNCLIILDNYEFAGSSDILDFARQVSGNSKVLMTSRRMIPEADWAMTLTGLSPSDASELVFFEARRLHVDQLEGLEENILVRLHVGTGEMPLAIRWAVGQIKQRGATVDGVLGLLATAKSDVFGTMFERSWKLIPQRARRVLCIFALLPNPLSRLALEAGSGIHGDSLDDALGVLIELSLIDSTGGLTKESRRFRAHPLTRAFVSNKMSGQRRFRTEASKRLVSFYRSVAAAADDVDGAPYLLIHSELDSLISVCSTGFVSDWEQARDIPLHLKWYLWEYGYWINIVEMCSFGYEQASARHDAVYAGRFAKEISWVNCRQGNIIEARGWLDRAQEAWAGISSVPRLESADLLALAGMLDKADGSLESAKVLLSRSLDIYIDQAPERIETLRVLTYLGELDQRLGYFDAAHARFAETLDRARSTKHAAAVSWSLGNLGELEFLQKNYAMARGLLTDGLTTASEISRYHTIANCAKRLGEISVEEGDIEAAVNYLGIALDKYDRLKIVDEVKWVGGILAELKRKLATQAQD